MGRNYAGVLGPLAFAVVLIRGAWGASSFAATMGTACLALWTFGAVGYVTGRIAEWIVEESVTNKLSAELAAQEEQARPEEKRAAAA
ncbi:MAG: hypothetical protein AB7O62_06480 [Pirellulales bacterium]